ncbi:site-specific DNA-methyltransferase [Mesotoga prima]|uniref:site-specific DNA-methyltransferase n=2 Tax=Mesotoga TaxID=1184396 RepID=UPI002BA76121|nr:site-specific DNA-methyltransferase [Mesotoga prima]HQC14895.1 site-specific DNA-methyltransferase [Mesotoga prima]
MDKMKQETADLTQENIARIEKLFPNVITEMKDENGKLKKGINFELLKQELSGDVIDGEECYDFTWVGKKASIVEANTPIRKTLRPFIEESKNWETTENLYIEGDNLDVLKLLQESYLNSVKMIYIDPPYNTGKDFIYRDKFMMDKKDYEEQLGMYDEVGNRLFQNKETEGRFHSNWCSMMYPRLKLARSLLSDDGVIFISIDDNELDNAKKMCDEVFGERHFLGIITWVKKTKPINSGNARFQLQRKIEYILTYCKSKGKEDVYKFILKSYGVREYKHEGKYGFCRLKDILDSDSGMKKRDSMKFPILGIVPPEGQRWKIGEEEMERLLASNRIEIVDGRVKVAIYPEDEEQEIMKPFWSHLDNIGTAEAGKKELNDLFEMKLGFDTVKPCDLMRELISHFGRDCIIMDFFSGSATTAHAVMQLNAEDGGNRKFIMVQLPEPCDEKSEAFKAGYKNICEIGKERIRRAGDQINEEIEEGNRQLKLGEEPKKPVDIGFRVLKVDKTNMKDIYYAASEYTQNLLTDQISNIKEDRTDLDLLYGVLLEWGLPLSLKHEIEEIDGVKIHIVDNDSLIACFSESVPEKVVRQIAKRQPLRAVFRDSSFASSSDKINVEEIFKLLAPNTSVKVI